MMSVDEAAIYDALTEVIDPELGLDFVSLGLIYEVVLDRDSGAVKVIFSLTTPTCPIGPDISEQIVDFVSALDGVSKVDTEMVWTPPWSPQMMTDDAKFAFGF